MKDKLTFKEYVVKQCQTSIMWLPVLQKMAGSSYGDCTVHKPVQTWLLQVCLSSATPFTPCRKEKITWGSMIQFSHLGNLRRHNWHFTLLLNCVWAAVQSGAIVENFAVNCAYEALVHSKEGWWVFSMRQSIWNLQGQCAVSHPNSLFEISPDSEFQQHSAA